MPLRQRAGYSSITPRQAVGFSRLFPKPLSSIKAFNLLKGQAGLKAQWMNSRGLHLFGHIRDWIFDLDNCLYPASSGLFELIDQRMGAYIERLLDVNPVEAKRVQKAHFHEHGTTLAG